MIGNLEYFGLLEMRRDRKTRNEKFSKYFLYLVRKLIYYRLGQIERERESVKLRGGGIENRLRDVYMCVPSCPTDQNREREKKNEKQQQQI